MFVFPHQVVPDKDGNVFVADANFLQRRLPVPLATSLSTGLICEWESEGHPILSAYASRDMTLAGRVFDKIDVPRLERDLFSSRNFNLSSAAERDHVLATWATMPIGNRTGRSPTELGP